MNRSHKSVIGVITPANGVMYTNTMYKACTVEVEGRELRANLILLDIEDFDVILEMD